MYLSIYVDNAPFWASLFMWQMVFECLVTLINYVVSNNLNNKIYFGYQYL